MTEIAINTGHYHVDDQPAENYIDGTPQISGGNLVIEFDYGPYEVMDATGVNITSVEAWLNAPIIKVEIFGLAENYIKVVE